MPKVMILVTAKWRDFCLDYPELVEGAEEDKKAASPAEMQDEIDDDDEDSKSSSRKSNRRSSRKAGAKTVVAPSAASSSKTSKSSKVPTLKIRIGKRKRGGSVSYTRGYNFMSMHERF